MATYPSPTLQNLTVNGTATLTDVSSAAATITGGTIDGTPRGVTTPAAIHATTINSTGTATLASVSSPSATLTGGTVDGVTIGGITPEAVHATDLSSSGTVSGAGFNVFATNANLAGTTTGEGAYMVGFGSGTVADQLNHYVTQQWEAYYGLSWGWPYNSIRLNLPTSNVGNNVVASEAAVITTRYMNATSDRAGAAYSTVQRTAGVASTHTYLDYQIADNTATSGFDITLVQSAMATNVQGNTIGGGWITVATPANGQPGQSWTAGTVYGQEINFGNRWSDFGLQRDFTAGRWVAGTLYAADVVGTWDGVNNNVYELPATYGVMFVPTGTSYARKIWNPVYIAKDCVPAGGVGVMIQGASAAGNAPSSAVELDNYLTYGIDGSRATYGTAGTYFPSGTLHRDGNNYTQKAYAPPTSGTWTQGDKRWNPIPAESGTAGSKYVTIGWICVASGTPGTWVDMRCLTGN